jgi:hypothetical protein
MTDNLRHFAAALTVLGLGAVACDRASTEPDPTTNEITISAPAVLFVGQSATVTVAPGGLRNLQWAVRRAAPWSAPELSGTPANDVLDIDPGSARITGKAVGRVWLIASVGTAMDSVLVGVEREESGPLKIHLGVNAVTPGFSVPVVTTRGIGWDPLRPYDEGRWLSSDPSVASWSATTSLEAVRLIAHAAGETVLTVEYGGQRDTFRLRVREPGPLTMDESGQCGLDPEGQLWCKGDNFAGELATLTATSCYRNCYQWPSSVPVQGAPNHRFTAISGSQTGYLNHRCGISADDSRAYCWGFNRALRDTLNRLGGPSGQSFCPESGLSDFYAPQFCSFEPLAVDRMITETLIFRTIKVIDHRTCGTTGAAGEPEEIWCWGDTVVPTRRAAFPTFAGDAETGS